jgi:hypothetical protein
MFSHPRSLGLLALSASLLAQPGGWSRAACADDPPPINPVPRAGLPENPVLTGARWTAPEREDIRVDIHARPLFKPDDGVLYLHLADDHRGGIRMTPADDDALRFADYALSPEVAGLLTFVHGTSLAVGRGDGQETRIDDISPASQTRSSGGEAP